MRTKEKDSDESGVDDDSLDSDDEEEKLSLHEYVPV